MVTDHTCYTFVLQHDTYRLGFLQFRKCLTSSNFIIMEKEGKPCLGVKHGEDELPLLILDVAVTLINFRNTDQLKRIPRMLIEAIMSYLKEVWSKVHERLLASNIRNASEDRCCYLSNLTAHNLAESIFRLSLDAPGLAFPMPSETIISCIFGPQKSSFINFMSDHWESLPYLMNKLPKDLDVRQGIFSSFTHSLTGEGTVARSLCSNLQRMVSCPPVALNEIDILSFLNDVKDTLGCPVTYQQDIRVVRTDLSSNTELHYFQESPSNGIEVLRSFSIDDILKCEIAYMEGYTIALRGMEFRFKSIAAIAQEMASLFGQPSVGANLYVTPPNSQGLACHYDDHCVFVCQLRGSKQWTIYPQPIALLPRLYEHIEIPKDLMMVSRQILLREGGVLYIPRGFAHEAHTVTDPSASSDACEFSVHLTLAIEVEPPFEWEGFVHVALNQWCLEMESDNFASDSSGILQAISVNILHAAIRVISINEPVFRKACLVASCSLPPETKDWVDNNHRATFNQLINKVNELASFTESLNFLQIAVKRNEDPFDWLRWLEHLNDGKLFVRDVWNFTSNGICQILSFIDEHKNNAEAAFAQIKSKFCTKVLFDDAKESFNILHAMYKEARMQYMNGLLALHLSS